MASMQPKRPDLLARWSRAALPVTPPASDAARRDRLVNVVVRTMESAVAEPRARAAPTRRQIALAVGIAAVLVLALGMGRQWAIRSGFASRGVAPFGSSHVMEPGVQAVAARSESASGLRLPSGAVVTMKPETRFHTSDLSAPSNAQEEVVVDLGRVEVEVPKLPAGHTFSVRTPDAVVTVHGTSFSVEVAKSASSGGTTTTVTVTRGVVSVLHADQETVLYAGMEWSSSGELPVVAAASAEPRAHAGPSPIKARPRSPAQDASRRADRVRVDPAPAIPPAAPEPESPSKGADLANQNTLFTEAQLARKQGDRIGALKLLDDLVRRYPAAPLSEDAHVETFRALAELGDHAGAAREARRYLTLYRNGFARDEARALALEPGSTR
jgi:hypothetical protein